MESRGQVSADQAAALLGVRLQTIYAYVSRGLLTRTHLTNEAGHRVSGFHRDEVLRLAAERTRVRAGSLEVLVETDLTMLDPKGALSFRGRPAEELARWRFEDVAELLWSGEGSASDLAPSDAAPSDAASPDAAPPDPALSGHDASRPARTWTLDPDEAAVAARAAAALPDRASDVDRLRAAVLALAAADPDREDLSPEHVFAVGRRAILAGIASIPLRGNEIDGSVEGRLWGRLSEHVATPYPLSALRTALNLLVDHELAASTMAARIAAGTGADPWLVLLTGLAALGGAAHGRNNILAEDLIRRLHREGVDVLVDHAAPGRIPGFGHQVYVDADPRAEILLDLVARLDPERWPALEELLLTVSSTHRLSPNVDLGLAALVVALDLAPGSGETIFAVGRMVGWLAHGLEEYPQGLRFRPRAVYTGDDFTPLRPGPKGPDPHSPGRNAGPLALASETVVAPAARASDVTT